MLLITHNGWFYCFSHKYQGCELNYNCSQELCPLHRIWAYLRWYEEELNRNWFNLFKLKQFGFKLFLLLLECNCVSKRSLEAFSGDFCYSIRDHYTGQQSKTPLREQIKFPTELKKKGEKKIFRFFVLIFHLFFSFAFFKKNVIEKRMTSSMIRSNKKGKYLFIQKKWIIIWIW